MTALNSRAAGLWLTLLIATPSAFAEELQILPGGVRLDGPHARQHLLVEARKGTAFVADRTSRARFVVEDPKVARIEPDGTLFPVGNGSTVVTATVDGQNARARVSVENFGREEPWNFRNHVESVLSKFGCNQGACHGAAAGKNGFRLTLRAYGVETDHQVLTRQSLGRRVNRTAPEESLMLLKATGAVEHGGGVRFSPESLEYQVIADWIAAGAPAPSADDPRVVSLRTFPDAVLARPGQDQQLTVQAVFSNGRIEDVTAWARFTSADETVAKVDDSGKVTVAGHGEASISVWYASQVQSATITSPFTTPIDAIVFREARRNNPIDAKNLEKLEALRIPPSPDAGDPAFLRRATLDATGALPTAEAVKAFLADTDLEKRRKLIDRLLESPEYVDYWSYKWSDLFLVSSNRLPAPAMWAFSRFIRRGVAENRPWDKFARDVLTASGSTLENGGANFFVLHRDPIDLTESASMAFLGLALTCARCHNHPMEKWTQDQYYGMASLFSRVRLKDGPAAGDVVVIPASEGEIRHPRTGKVMPPQPLDGKARGIDDPTDRRSAFADWLAAPDNPYFAKAAVNRVWANFFGDGLVSPEDDLRATNPASDEALLRWLVEDFRGHGFDLKHLIRTIMNSAVYARSSDPVPGNESDSRFLSRYPAKRLPAEVILDAIARVTEVPSKFPGYPEGWRSLQLPDSKVESTFLSSFGRPERLNTCSCERSAEPSMSQALHLANGETINEKLRAKEGAVSSVLSAGATDVEVVERLFLSALGRPPREEEQSRLLRILAEAVVGLTDPKAVTEARREAIEDLYWATLTSNEFLFNH